MACPSALCHVWHLFVVVVRLEAPVSRNQFSELLPEMGIDTSVTCKRDSSPNATRRRSNPKVGRRFGRIPGATGSVFGTRAVGSMGGTG